MIRTLAAVMTGYVVWTAIYFAGNGGIRGAFPDAHDELGGSREPGVLALYLLVSMVASLVAGFLTGKMAAPPQMRAVWIVGGLLLATGIPVQIGYWDVLPVWFHLVFLGLLVPLTVRGGLIATASDRTGTESL